MRYICFSHDNKKIGNGDLCSRRRCQLHPNAPGGRLNGRPDVFPGDRPALGAAPAPAAPIKKTQSQEGLPRSAKCIPFCRPQLLKPTLFLQAKCSEYEFMSRWPSPLTMALKTIGTISIQHHLAEIYNFGFQHYLAAICIFS